MMVEAFDQWERLEKECGQQLYMYVDNFACVYIRVYMKYSGLFLGNVLDTCMSNDLGGLLPGV